VAMMSTIFLDVTPCSLLGIYGGCFQNFNKILPDYAAQYPRGQYFSQFYFFIFFFSSSFSSAFSFLFALFFLVHLPFFLLTRMNVPSGSEGVEEGF
jgi:hypothetical protein